jgi:hypothetical protein
MSESALESAIRAFATDRRYTAATVQRWLDLDPLDRGTLLDLAQELRLGEHQLYDVWEWAEEIGQRDGRSLSGVLSLESVVAARRQPVGRNDKLKRVKGALRRLRFPALSAAEDRLAALIRSLRLPPDVRISVPEFLEGDEVRVEIVARTPEDLRNAVASLQEAAGSQTCDDLFAVLGGVE